MDGVIKSRGKWNVSETIFGTVRRRSGLAKKVVVQSALCARQNSPFV